MKRARERERAHVIDILPYTVIFLCGQAIPQGQAGCCRKALCDGINLPFFLCMLPSLRWDEQDSPRDASTISTTSIQSFMMYKT